VREAKRYFHFVPTRNRHGEATRFRRYSISGCVVPGTALSSRIYLLLENASISVPTYYFRAVLNFRRMRSVHHSYAYSLVSGRKINIRDKVFAVDFFLREYYVISKCLTEYSRLYVLLLNFYKSARS